MRILLALTLCLLPLLISVAVFIKARKNPRHYIIEGFAIAGMALGSLFFLFIVAAVKIGSTVDHSRNEGCVISHLRTISYAEKALVEMNIQKNCGDLPVLASNGLIDSKVATGQYCGYHFEMTVSPENNICEVQATPKDSWKGIRSFYLSTEDGVIRGADKEGAPADKNDSPLADQLR